MDHAKHWFGSAIKDNIAYGKDDAAIEYIRPATKLANDVKFINNYLSFNLSIIFGYSCITSLKIK